MMDSPQMIKRHLDEDELMAAVESVQSNDSELARGLFLIKNLYAGDSLDEAATRVKLSHDRARSLIEAWNSDGFYGLQEATSETVSNLRADYDGSKPGENWFKELDEAVIDEGRCIKCGTCVSVCPVDSIGIGEEDLPELIHRCIGCSLCWDFCPRGGFRYERQWKITGGENNVSGAGDPINEFSAKVSEKWHENAQDGGVVTSILIHLLENDKIDGALIATESDEDPWKAEPFIATTPEECIENAGSFYNQTMALKNLDVGELNEKFPEKDSAELSLALVGTPCEIEGLQAVQDFEWHYGSHDEGIRAIEYTIALMCTKNFNYKQLIGEQLEEQRDISLDSIGKLDIIHGELIVYGNTGEELLREDIENFHDAALKGCDECADFTGYCADIAVGSVGSSAEFSSVIVRTEKGLEAWSLTKQDLDYHDLEDRTPIGKLQSLDKKEAFEGLNRSFDPDAPRFIDYLHHAEKYGVDQNPNDPGVKFNPKLSE